MTRTFFCGLMKSSQSSDNDKRGSTMTTQEMIEMMAEVFAANADEVGPFDGEWMEIDWDAMDD